MKKFIYLIILLIVFPCFVFGCSNENNDNLTDYEIVVDYDNEAHISICSEKINYFNNTGNNLEFICLHLYPNAFRENAENKIVSSVLMNKAYPNGKSYGNIEIENVKNGEYALNFEISGEDENILKINFNNILQNNQNIEISIDFNLFLPNIEHRFGYGEKTVNFGNFYPIICVYENNDFVTDIYCSNGDPFYSDCSNYLVKIICDENLIIASSGIKKEAYIEKNKKISIYEGKKIRDFAFVLSSEFNIVEKYVDDILVKYFYFDDEDFNSSLQTAVDSIKTFSNLFGKYPYEEYSVVQSNFVYGGMEYPNLVYISDEISGEDLKYVIVHETAHQWWYGVVGNNEYQNAWIDEGLVEYSTALFYDENEAYNVKYENIISNAKNNYEIFLKVYKHIFGSVDTSMNRKLNEYKTEPEYVNCTYVKGLILFDEIQNEIGKKNMIKILKKYFNEKKYQNVAYDEFLKILKNNAGNDVKNTIEKYVEGEENF